MNKKTVTILYLAFVVLLALFLRSVNITENPPELFSDEIINFVSAKSILEKGHDIHGRLLPYFIDRVELRPPVYGYFSYASSMIFGENVLGIRAPAIFFGIVSVILVYFLALEFFKDAASGIFASFLMAIIPWHIHYSRLGWEPAALLPFLLLSTYLFFYGVNRNKKSILVLSFASFTFTIYTYQAAPMYSFLFIACLVVLHGNYFLRHWKVFLLGVLLSLFILIPYLWTVTHEPHLYFRAQQIFTFSKGLNQESVNIFFTNYLSHFSPRFLFIRGDPNLRHGAQTGTIYLVMLPFLVSGLVYLIKSHANRKVIIFIIFWIVIFPLGGSLTNDGVPHATRTLVGAPLMCILSGYGVSKLCQSIAYKSGKKMIAYILYALIIILSVVSLSIFSKKYFYRYPEISYIWWDYGNKEIFSKVRKLENDFERACLENLNYSNELQLLEFYARESKLEFIDNINDPRCSLRGTIIVQKSRRITYRNSRLLDVVKAPDGKRVYYIYITKS